MPVIQNIVKNSVGGALAGTVTIDLVVFDANNTSSSLHGFVDLAGDYISDYTINIGTTLNYNVGSWSTTVAGNISITDSYGVDLSSFYKVTEIAGGTTRVYYIQVPTTGGPYWVGDLIAIDPATVADTFTLNNLHDVHAPDPTDGQVIRYNAAQEYYEPVTLPGIDDVVAKDIITFSAPGILQVVDGTMGIVVPYAFVVTGVYLRVGTAPLNGSVICDALIDNVSIFAFNNGQRRPIIAETAQISTLGIPGLGDLPTGAAADVLTINIENTGDLGSEGTDLAVSVSVNYT